MIAESPKQAKVARPRRDQSLRGETVRHVAGLFALQTLIAERSPAMETPGFTPVPV